MGARKDYENPNHSTRAAIDRYLQDDALRSKILDDELARRVAEDGPGWASRAASKTVRQVAARTPEKFSGVKPARLIDDSPKSSLPGE